MQDGDRRGRRGGPSATGPLRDTPGEFWDTVSMTDPATGHSVDGNTGRSPGGPAQLSAVLSAVGPRLRALRRGRGLTLAEVGRRSGLSVSVLSRVETGRRQPTLDLLIPLARVYRVSLDEMVDPPQTGDPRVNLKPRAFTGPSSDRSVIVPLTGYPGRVQVFKHVLGPREPRLVSHPGYAWLYVLAGSLRLLFGDPETGREGREGREGGEIVEELVLQPGETARFDPLTPHWFGPVGQTTVELLHLFGPQGHGPVTRLSRP